MRQFNKAANFESRAFVFKDGIYACGKAPAYFECVAVDALSQDRGDITEPECYSPYRYGEFEKLTSFSGELSRLTTTLTTYMSRASASDFLKFFKDDCPFDLHIHFGSCQNPSDFDQFDKAIILTDVRPTSFSTEALMTLASGDKALIQESIDVSAREMIELINLQYSEVASTVTVDGGFVKGIVADTKTCGGACATSSDGCQVQFAVTSDGFLYYSQDGGLTWAAQEVIDIDVETTSIPIDLMFVGESLVIVTDDDLLYVADRDSFLLSPSSATWDVLDVSGSIAASAADGLYNDGVIVGDAGVVLGLNIYKEVTVLHNGNVTSENLSSVDVSFNTILAGGANGALIYSSNDGETWSLVTSPTSDDITSVLVKNNKNWIIGTATGELWCTDNEGLTWTAASYPGSTTATTPITSLVSPMSHIVYMLQGNRVIRSVNGGHSWKTEPSNSKKPFPTITKASIIACADNINTLTVVGTNAATGSIVLGTPVN